MNVEQTKRTLINMPPRLSVLLLGNHGIGKSDIVRQVAAYMSKKLGKPFYLVDFRLAQCEVADIIGMMRHVDQGEVIHSVYKDGVKTSETKKVINTTVHDVAEWFPQDPDSHGYLLLDELFRAPRDIQNAIMELALDYRYHFRELPMGWRVVAASNDNMDLYNGAFPDPALYDRFLKIPLKPTTKEWLAWAKLNEVHRSVLQYISKVPDDLVCNSIEPGKICQSPRSWANFSTCLTHFEKNEEPILKEDLDYTLLLAKGYLGDTLSINFTDYIRANYRIYTGEDILNKWDKKMKDEISKILVPELQKVNEEVVKFLKNKNSIDKKESENLLKYLQTIPSESVSSFWGDFTKECRKVAETWHKFPGAKPFMLTIYSKSKALEKKKTK